MHVSRHGSVDLLVGDDIVSTKIGSVADLAVVQAVLYLMGSCLPFIRTMIEPTFLSKAFMLSSLLFVDSWPRRDQH